MATEHVASLPRPMPLPGRAILFLALSLLLTTTYSAWTGVMGLTFDSNRPIESKSLHCPSGFLTGIRVKYGRTRQEDRDQAALFPEELRFERPVEQEQYIRWWLENRAKLGAPGDGGEVNVDALKIRWYPAIYAPFLGSLVQEGDITQLVPKGERDVAILEEPEHLNW